MYDNNTGTCLKTERWQKSIQWNVSFLPAANPKLHSLETVNGFLHTFIKFSIRNKNLHINNFPFFTEKCMRLLHVYIYHQYVCISTCNRGFLSTKDNHYSAPCLFHLKIFLGDVCHIGTYSSTDSEQHISAHYMDIHCYNRSQFSDTKYVPGIYWGVLHVLIHNILGAGDSNDYSKSQNRDRA